MGGRLFYFFLIQSFTTASIRLSVYKLFLVHQIATIDGVEGEHSILSRGWGGGRGGEANLDQEKKVPHVAQKLGRPLPYHKNTFFPLQKG